MSRLAALLLPLLLLGTLGAPAVATPADRAAAPTAAQRYVDRAHLATNEQRAAQGLRPLRLDRCLRRAAVRQAAEMARTGTMSHQDLAPVLSACGLSGAGENVAYGFATGRRVVVSGWMTSPGHRASILQLSYRREGIGAVRDGEGRWWVAQVFGTRA